MMDIEGVFNSVAKGMLWTVYKNFFASVLMAFLFTFAYRFFRRYGVRKTFCIWMDRFIKNREFRNVFIFAFIIAMVLYDTLLCRISFVSPWNDIWGSWALRNSKGEFSSTSIQNICLFVPVVFFALLLFHDKIFVKRKENFRNVIGFSICFSFASALSIELIQTFLFLGMIQVSDLCYNTLGGVIGGVIYYIIRSTIWRH